MQGAFGKRCVLACLALVTVHQSEAFLVDTLQEVGTQKVTCYGLFRTWVVHTLARNVATKNLPDAELFGVGSAKLHAHEVWAMLASAVVEYMNAHFVGRSSQANTAAKLAIYGECVHKVVAELWCALGLNEFFDDEVKKNYDLYGHGFMQAVFAQELHKNVRM